MKGRVKGLFLFFAHTTPPIFFYLSSTLCVVELIHSAPKTKVQRKQRRKREVARRTEI